MSGAETDRRRILKRLAAAGAVLGGSGLLAGLAALSGGRWREPGAAALPKIRTVPTEPGLPPLAIARGGVVTSVRAAVGAVGGIARFVLPGETVLVKPNMAWDRTPAQGANTNPEVVAEVVRLCLEEGRAARVVVADVPVHDAARVEARSGIGEAARKAGAEVLVPPGPGFVLARLGGSVLDTWEVFAPVMQADRIVNVPVVKDHGLTRLTCGLKNGYGLLGGTRARLHQQIHLSILDLALAFRPTLTVVDATRVMMRAGPTGGRLDDVVSVGAVAAGTDAVGLDAWGATLLGVDPGEIPYLALAESRGLGSILEGREPKVEIHAGA